MLCCFDTSKKTHTESFELFKYLISIGGGMNKVQQVRLIQNMYVTGINDDVQSLTFPGINNNRDFLNYFCLQIRLWDCHQELNFGACM